MNLFIDDYGARLELEGGMLKISLGETVHKLSFVKLHSINIMKAVSVTTPVLIEAARHQVPVLLYGSNGKVEVWLWSHKYGNIATLRKQQAYFADSPDALRWMASLLASKVKHQSQNLRWIADRMPSVEAELQAAVKRMDAAIGQMEVCEDPDRLRGLEGMSSRRYWACIARALGRHLEFEGRRQRAPRDAFNACLNYLYGILYGQTEASLVIAGLDPYMGIYHAIRHDKPTLAYDLIEPFRPWADRILIELVLRKKISEAELAGGKTKLGKSSIRLLIGSYFDRMNQRSLLNRKKIRKSDHIHYHSRQLAKTIMQFDGLANGHVRH